MGRPASRLWRKTRDSSIRLANGNCLEKTIGLSGHEIDQGGARFIVTTGIALRKRLCKTLLRSVVKPYNSTYGGHLRTSLPGRYCPLQPRRFLRGARGLGKPLARLL